MTGLIGNSGQTLTREWVRGAGRLDYPRLTTWAIDYAALTRWVRDSGGLRGPEFWIAARRRAVFHWNEDFMRPFLTRGKVVEIEEGETKNLDPDIITAEEMGEALSRAGL